MIQGTTTGTMAIINTIRISITNKMQKPRRMIMRHIKAQGE